MLRRRGQDGSDERRRGERPRPVVDEDDPAAGCGAVAVESSSSAARPAATDSWRRSPPATTATTLPDSHGAVTDLGDPIGRRHDDDPLDRVDAASASIDQARSGRPPTTCASLSTPPIRLDEPAATTIASAATARPSAQSRRGWAKIIRPATVWRTRVTATSRSLSM